MFRLLLSIFRFLVSPASLEELALENLALRQQLAVLKRQCPRPRLRKVDRWFWVRLSRVWSKWRRPLLIVRPETVVGWSRRGFRLYWTWISKRGRAGRPPVSAEVRDLIRKMAHANPLWGAPRIRGELLKLGIEISERTVSRLMPRRGEPPSQTWRAFLDNHVQDLVSLDFFTVPTATFRVLFVLVVLAHRRRHVLHFNVTEHPTALWTAHQMVEAFPDDTAPAVLVARSRQGLWRGVPSTLKGNGHPGSADRTSESLAKSLRRKTGGPDSARMLGSCDRGRREAPAEDSHQLL
jgi:putative transposase